jgi:hypothetical protein
MLSCSADSARRSRNIKPNKKDKDFAISDYRRVTSYLEVIPGPTTDCRILAALYSTCLCSRQTGQVVLARFHFSGKRVYQDLASSFDLGVIVTVGSMVGPRAYVQVAFNTQGAIS